LLIIGGVLGIVPVLAANLFMRDFVRSQAEERLSLAADRLLLNVEQVVQESIDVISLLPHRSRPSCTASIRKQFHLLQIRHHVLHDIGLLNDDRELYCSSLRGEVKFQVRSKPVTSQVDHLSFQSVYDDISRKQGLLVAWRVAENVSIAAFIPDDHLILNSMPIEYASASSASVMLATGSVLVETSPEIRYRKKSPFAVFDPDPAWTRDLIKTIARSSRYPVMIWAGVPFETVWMTFSGAMDLINGLAILIGAMIMFFFVRLSVKKEPPSYSIEEGIKKREFIPYYQPVIDIQTGRLAGCEVLVRWRKPDGSILSPGSFIDTAEATGLAMPMTTLLIEQVEEDLSEAYAAHPQLKAGINLFNRHFDDLGIVGDIERIFGNSGVRFNQLMFEVTERQPLDNLDRARAIIARIQALGSKVALDDAGTGHGGFAYLQKLGMDVIKIDKLFVDSIEPGVEMVPIVDSLTNMAMGMGMTVVAEGVETEPQLDYLRSIGVHQAQGYLFAPALPAKAYLELIDAIGGMAGKDDKVSGDAQGPEDYRATQSDQMVQSVANF
jgi:sensor c-di-GMP phosphodiesterase-like protein